MLKLSIGQKKEEDGKSRIMADPEPQEFYIQQPEGFVPLLEFHVAPLGSNKHFKLIYLARNSVMLLENNKFKGERKKGRNKML